MLEFPPVGENMTNGRLRYYEITKEHMKALDNKKEVCDVVQMCGKNRTSKSGFLFQGLRKSRQGINFDPVT